MLRRKVWSPQDVSIVSNTDDCSVITSNLSVDDRTKITQHLCTIAVFLKDRSPKSSQTKSTEFFNLLFLRQLHPSKGENKVTNDIIIIGCPYLNYVFPVWRDSQSSSSDGISFSTEHTEGFHRDNPTRYPIIPRPIPNGECPEVIATYDIITADIIELL